MKYCTKCGQEIADAAVICVHCGAEVETAPTPVNATALDPNDAPSTGFAVLGFFFPLIGLILWLIYKDKSPKKAKSAGKGALIGFIVGIVFSVIYSIIMGVIAASMSSYYYY